MRTARLFTASLGMASALLLAACQPSTQAAPLDPAVAMDAAKTAPGASGTPADPARQSLEATCSGNQPGARGMEEAVNAVRGVEGKVILAENAKLMEIAQSHACDAARMGRAQVEGSNGSSVVDRARAVGYPTCGVVQLVSVGGDPVSVVNGWMRSGPHREQILGQNSTDIGAGVTTGPDGRQWWSVVLGHNCS